MNENKGQIQTVPMASFEASQSRHSRTVRTLLTCWVATIVALGFVIALALTR